MTKEKFPSPNLWLDIQLCETIYRVYKREYSRKKLGSPLPDFNSRFGGVLESILGSVQIKASILGLDVAEVAASYFVKFAKSQTFFDGNKRLAVVFTNMFLIINGYSLNVPPDGLRNLALMLSKDRKTDVNVSIRLLSPIFRDNIIEFEKR